MNKKEIEIDVLIGFRKISSKELREMNRCQDLMNKSKSGKKAFLKYVQEYAYPVNQDCTRINFEAIEDFDIFINKCRRAMGEL